MNIKTKRMDIRLCGSILIKSLILFGIEFQIGIYGWLSLRKIVFLVLCAGFLRDFSGGEERRRFQERYWACCFQWQSFLDMHVASSG